MGIIKTSLFTLIYLILLTHFQPLILSQSSKNGFLVKERIRFEEIKPDPNITSFYSVSSIVRTANGFLWLGTDLGLIRYDGTKFTVYDTSNTKAFKDNPVDALYEDKKGILWIGTNYGLVSYKNKAFTLYEIKDSLARRKVISITEDENGVIWAGTNGGSIYQFKENALYPLTGFKDIEKAVTFFILCEKDGTKWFGTNARGIFKLKDGVIVNYSFNNVLPNDMARSIYKDSKGIIWIGTGGGGLVRYFEGKFKVYNTLDGLPNNFITSIIEDKNNTLWLGTGGGGLVQYKNERFKNYTTSHGLTNDFIKSLFLDNEGNFWIGTKSGELNKMREDVVINFTTRDGLSNNVILSVYEDKSGNIWSGTNGNGVDRISGKKITNFSLKDGLTNNSVSSIHQDKTGTFWFGTNGGGLNRYKNGVFKSFTTKDGFVSNYIQAIFEDSKGRLWIGTRRGLVLFQGEKFRDFFIGEEATRNNIKAICEDKSGNIWAASRGGAIRISKDTFQTFNMKSGLLGNNIYSLFCDNEGSVWIGNNRGGLNRYRNNKFEQFTIKTGQQESPIYYINEDNKNNLWITTDFGIFIVNKNELDEYADGKKTNFNVSHIGKEEGMLTPKCSGNQQPCGWKTKEGKFLFATYFGLAFIDPENVILLKNPNPPEVFIDNIRTDNKNIDFYDLIEFEPGKKTFEFNFVGLSLVNPQNNRYKYKLENFDKDWTDAGYRTTAYYTNLPAGHYKFKVTASNNDGVWNERGAEINFYIKPYFYETFAFIVFCGFCFVIILFLSFKYRVRHIKFREKELLALVNERTDSLRKSETKLLDINASKDRFFSIISHDMKNLFGIMVPFSEILKTEFDSLPKDRVKEIIDRINIASKALFDMLTNLLDWASLQTERMVCQPIKIRLHETVNKIFGLLMETAFRKNIELVNMVNQDAIVYADKNMLDSILQNLVYNALKFTHSGGTITILDKAFDNDFIVITVKDTGVGIPPADLEKIFKIDIKTSTIGTAEETGSGLGLILCKDMVVKNGGTIKVESEVGKGTSFIFTLLRG